MIEQQLKQMFEDAELRDEPPMRPLVTDYVTLGEGRLRRRRVVTWGGGIVGIAAAAIGVAVAVPGTNPESGRVAPAAAVPDTQPPQSRWPDQPPLPTSYGSFEATRQLLFDTAAEHLDPERGHLAASGGATGGSLGDAVEVGGKFEWTNPGETGLGMVFVAVTTPGYVSADDYALEQFASFPGGTVVDLDSFTEQTLPGTDEKAWVASGVEGEYGDLEVGVIYERDDGSLVGLGVLDLFGNNSTQPVSEVGVTLEQAAAFVTDADLEVRPGDLDAEDQWNDLAAWVAELDEDDQRSWLEQLKSDKPEAFDYLYEMPGPEISGLEEVR